MKVVFIGGNSLSMIRFRLPILKELRKRGHEVITLTGDMTDAGASLLKALGIEADTFFLNRAGANPKEEAKAFHELYQKIKQRKPDVVVCYTPKLVAYGCLCAKWLGVKHIFALFTGMGTVFTDVRTTKRKLFRSLISKLLKSALKHCRLIFFQNENDLEEMDQLGVIPKGKKTKIMAGSGVDLSFYEYSEPNFEPFTFLLVGRVISEKGIYEFERAAREIKRDFPEVRFQILGHLDEHPTSISEKEVEEWSKLGHIEYLGGAEDVRPFLKKCSVFVLPSYREGMPRATLEAMAMGRAVITTDVPGCRQTVVEGKNGLLVPSKDPDALEQAMRGMIVDQEKVLLMGKKSRLIAEESFDDKKISSEFVDALQIDSV